MGSLYIGDTEVISGGGGGGSTGMANFIAGTPISSGYGNNASIPAGAEILVLWRDGGNGHYRYLFFSVNFLKNHSGTKFGTYGNYENNNSSIFAKYNGSSIEFQNYSSYEFY